MNPLAMQLAARGAGAPKRITAGDVSFAKSADVISNAQKFIFPLPAF